MYKRQVYAKRPFAGPEAVLAYLSRYTHRVAIANRRLRDYDGHTVAFDYKDYRAKNRDRYKTMRLDADEFIRRFLIHVLPAGFHRIRHYGLFASHLRARYLPILQHLLEIDGHDDIVSATDDEQPTPFVCSDCGAPMAIIDVVDPTGRSPPRRVAA